MAEWAAVKEAKVTKYLGYVDAPALGYWDDAAIGLCTSALCYIEKKGLGCSKKALKDFLSGKDIEELDRRLAFPGEPRIEELYEPYKRLRLDAKRKILQGVLDKLDPKSCKREE